MKKKLMATVLCAAMVALTLSGCGAAAESAAPAAETPAVEEVAEAPAAEEVVAEAPATETHKLGITIQDLTNPYWAGVMSKLQELLDAKGWEYTLVDCADNSGTQIGQIENFITSGCDFIMVHPSDAAAVEDVCKEALDAGIKVMCWDDPMENTTANWVLDNTELGVAIGKTAAEFINAHFDSNNKAEVCVIGYPSTKVLLERANGIKQGLESDCNDNYEIVAEVDGIEAGEAQTNVETALSAHPDCKIFVGIGAGAMIGANEALLETYGGAGNIPEDVGVITTDVTTQQLESLQAGDEAVRAIVGFEGSNTDTASACLEMYERILGGEDFSGDKHNVFRGTMAITPDNIEKIMSTM